jgi:hypothetical protein
MVKWIGLFLAGFVAIFSGLLFATGVAQKHLIPVIKMQVAAARAKPAAKSEAAAEGAPAAGAQVPAADSAVAAASAAAPAATPEAAVPAAAAVDPVKEAVARAMPQPRSAEQQKNDAALAKIYAEMKPEDAARILRQLDDATAMAIVSHLKADKAARLLEAFGPERSVRITSMWAGMAGTEGAR